MAKLGEQLKAQEEEVYDISDLPRTQRKRYALAGKRIDKQEELAEKEYQRKIGLTEKTEKDISGLTFDQYKTYYSGVKENWLKDLLPSPQEIEAKEKAEIDEKIARAREEIGEYRQDQIQAKRDSNTATSKSREESYWLKAREYGYYAQYWDEGMKYLSQQGVSYGAVRSWVRENVKYRMANYLGQRAEREGIAKREAEIKGLLATGYTPLLIEQSYKGALEKADIVYINPTLRDVVKVKGTDLNVRKLQEAKAFQVPQTPAWILQETQISGGVSKDALLTDTTSILSQSEPKQSALTIGDVIEKQVTGKVRKKRKFGLQTAFDIFGVKVTKVVNKTNPNIPIRQTDQLTSVDKQPKVVGQAVKQVFSKETLRGIGEFYKKTGKGIIDVPVGIYKGIKSVKEGRGFYEELPPKKLVVGATAFTPSIQPPSQEVLARDFKLHYDPSTQEMLYLPKAQTSPDVKYKPVEKLAISTPTKKDEEAKLRAFGMSEEIPKGYQRVSPSTLERVYGAEGLTAEESYAQHLKIKKKASVGEKILFKTAQVTGGADPFGLKSGAVKVGGIIGVATKGKGLTLHSPLGILTGKKDVKIKGYSYAQTEQKLRDIEKQAFTQYAYGETGEKRLTGLQYTFRSPVSQTALMYGGGVVGGAVIGAVAPAFIPAKLVALAGKPIGKAISLSLIHI